MACAIMDYFNHNKMCIIMMSERAIETRKRERERERERERGREREINNPIILIFLVDLEKI